MTTQIELSIARLLRSANVELVDHVLKREMYLKSNSITLVTRDTFRATIGVESAPPLHSLECECPMSRHSFWGLILRLSYFCGTSKALSSDGYGKQVAGAYCFGVC